MNIEKNIELSINAAERACTEILSIYNSADFKIESKSDNSPLTLADKNAHKKIVKILDQTRLPILSEEGKDIPYQIRKHWEYFWLVDPLDGTKEFVKRNGEFTVNIALIHNGRPVYGVVAVPVTGELYYGGLQYGVHYRKDGVDTKLSPRRSADLSAPNLRVVASRSHMNPETEDFIRELKDPTLVSAGSSLKFLLLANGQADVYPRFAPTMEWDTAAAHAIVRGLGLKVYKAGGTDELEYNKENLLNPYFLVV